MMWKNVVGARLAGDPKEQPFQGGDIGEEEEEVFVVPEEIPSFEPEPAKEPAREPAKVPEKAPQKVGQVDDDDEGELPEAKKPRVVHGEYIGYRHMRAAKRDGQWIFHSPIKPMPWERGEQTAECRAGGGHEAPHKGCHCGFFAKWDEGATVSEFGHEHWITQNKAWGRILPGSKGFRAQKMMISGIRPPCCEQCGDPATHIISAGDGRMGGRPTCEEHRPDDVEDGTVAVTSTPVHEVAKALSDYYGGAEIRHHGESWGNEDMADFEQDFGGRSAYGTRSDWKRITEVDVHKKG